MSTISCVLETIGSAEQLGSVDCADNVEPLVAVLAGGGLLARFASDEPGSPRSPHRHLVNRDFAIAS
jgi:hypothetical protein